MIDKKELTVSQLFYYPLKSGKPIQLLEAEFSEKGIINDRKIVVVEKSNLKFVTIRNNKKLFYVETIINDNIISIKVPSKEKSIEINIKEEMEKSCESKKIEVTVWDMTCKALILNDEVNKYLSEFLELEVYLLYPITVREIKSSKKNIGKVKNTKDSDSVYFADLAPVLVVFEESLNYLNSILKTKGEKEVKIENFRPNIVLKGGIQFEEKSLHDFQIGNYRFRSIKPCVRCKLTTFDIDLGDYNKNKEPLETLNDLNTIEGFSGCIFGQNYCVDVLSESELQKVKVGDKIILLTK